MSIFGRVFGRDRGAAIERREPVVSAQSGGVSKVPAHLLEAGFGGSRIKGAPRATPATAERHATVFACCNVLAGDLAKIPLHVMQRGTDGRDVKVRDHNLAYLLNTQAAPGVPAITARFAAVYAFALRGQGYIYAPRDGAGEVEFLEVLRPDRVSMVADGRRRWFQFEDGEGVQRTVGTRQMVVMRYMAEDGWTGRSPIAVAADSMGLAIAGQDAAVKSATGSNVRAVAKLAGHYQNDEQYQRNRARLKAAMTDGDGVAVIGDTDDIKTLNMSAADMQLLENRKFDREQIAAMWRVPPSKLQMLEHGVKANGQQQAVDYKSDGLSHWGGFAAAYLSEGLLTEAEKRAGLFLRFDYAALMEATTREAYEATVKAVGGPFKTPNEGRADHGLPPVTDGDALYPPANMTRDTKTETEGADE